MIEKLIVWDSDAQPLEVGSEIYLWNGYTERDSVHSLLRYIDNNADDLRRRYLEFIHELGESRIDGRRVIDHLALDGELSYWWMTLLVEKSPWKSPSITDAIRLMAIEDIVCRHQPKHLKLVSADARLDQSIRGLCESSGIGYEWVTGPTVRRGLTLRSIYRRLPIPLQAVISFARHVWVRWQLRYVETDGWFAGEPALFFCSYFFNFDTARAEHGSFHSRYWETLPTLLKQRGLRSNWLEVYVPHDSIPTARAAVHAVERINQRRETEGFHTFVDSQLSWRIVWRVVRSWLRLNMIHAQLGPIEGAFRPPQSRISLWPVLRRDWEVSMRGPTAINNLLWIELFDSALREVPQQKKGFYLCENQAWERALIHGWRKHGHAQLIAVPHSTVRFWDLRYFFDPRTVLSCDAHRLPRADLVALNGKSALAAYRVSGYPDADLVECEALRYGYLNEFELPRTPGKDKVDLLRVLILGDYQPSSTVRMLRLLEGALPHIAGRAVYAVRSHPHFPVDVKQFQSLHLETASGPLAAVLKNFDVAYSSNLTSAALDAYLAGLPVVVMLDETELNFNPLRGQPNVRFVSTSAALAGALQMNRETDNGDRSKSDLLFLDPKFPRWSRLLAN